MNDAFLLDYLIADGVLTDLVDSGVSAGDGISVDAALDLCHWNSAARDALIDANEADEDYYSDIWTR